MITKDEFVNGRNSLAQKEVTSIMNKIEHALDQGLTQVKTYDSFRTSETTLVHLLNVELAKYGWSLTHSVYHGDQRDPGTTHTWSLK